MTVINSLLSHNLLHYIFVPEGIVGLRACLHVKVKPGGVCFGRTTGLGAAHFEGSVSERDRALGLSLALFLVIK